MLWLTSVWVLTWQLKLTFPFASGASVWPFRIRRRAKPGETKAA